MFGGRAKGEETPAGSGSGPFARLSNLDVFPLPGYQPTPRKPSTPPALRTGIIHGGWRVAPSRACRGRGEPMNGCGTRTPIYFRSLEVENVRCFAERQRLDCSDEHGNPFRWVLILGDNGVGKTTLLQCLAWMRPVISSVEGDSHALETEPALSNEENRVWDSLIRVGGEGDVKVNLKAKLSAGQCFGNEKTESINEPVVTEVDMTGSNGLLQESTSRRHDISDKLRNTVSNLAMFGYGAARRPGTLREGRPDALASLFQDSTELYDAEDVLLKLDHRAAKSEDRQDGQDRKILDRVKKILATTLPDIERGENIRIFGPAMFGPSTAPSGVRFRTPYGLVPLSALSLGYQTTLTWVVDLALRLFEHYPESPDSLSEPGIVLIDNIDLHLHPRWQRRVMENLSSCFPAIQFIATAHSPLIVQAAENATIVVLRRENEGVIIDKHSESVNDWRADQILASDLFGIPSRSRGIEELRKERDELLEKLDRTQTEEVRLDQLINRLDSLPTAEDPEDRDAMDLIRRVAARLKEDGLDRP